MYGGGGNGLRTQADSFSCLSCPRLKEDVCPRSPDATRGRGGDPPCTVNSEHAIIRVAARGFLGGAITGAPGGRENAMLERIHGITARATRSACLGG
jgi:hypothetical protein